MIKGVCHGIYSKTDIVTKAPAAALTVPKSVIENDYIYRKNFKEKYGIELPKYITILSYFWDSMTDDLFMQLDDIDTNLLSNTNGNRWEYIGELLSDVIFDAGSTELSSEISRQRKSKTPDNAKIEKIESKLDDMFSKREFEKGDGTFGISLSKENAETYPKARKKGGGVLDEMLSKLPEYANELTECANESKEAGKEEEDDLFEKYKETFLLYTPKYGASFIKLAKEYREDFLEPVQTYGEIFIETLLTKPQYKCDIIGLAKKFEENHLEPFASIPNAFQYRVEQYDNVINRTKVIGNYSQTQIDSNPSSVLRAEMYDAGIYSPPYPNCAHHIVPIKDENCPEASRILSYYKIDKNAAVNGVFLPYIRNKYVISESMHTGGHLQSYYDKVNDVLSEAKEHIDEENYTYEQGRDYICKTLNELRNQLLNGSLRTNNF